MFIAKIADQWFPGYRDRERDTSEILGTIKLFNILWVYTFVKIH